MSDLLTAEEARKLSSPLALILKAIREAAEEGDNFLHLFEEERTFLFEKDDDDPYMNCRSFEYSKDDLEELKKLGYTIEEVEAVYSRWIGLKYGRWDKAIQKSKQTKWFSKELKYPDLAEGIKEYLSLPKVHSVKW